MMASRPHRRVLPFVSHFQYIGCRASPGMSQHVPLKNARSLDLWGIRAPSNTWFLVKRAKHYYDWFRRCLRAHDRETA